ncbi:MAG: inositol monophosphatase [Methyloprofundus sp.]|nr:inositol monophosphatase [Methyloprofundus sp.]
MKLCASDLFLLSQCAISAAYQAGCIITKHACYPVSVNSKKGGSSLASQMVTEVDYLCQDIILQALMPTCAVYDLALLTEESPDSLARLEKDFFWCIDPLDGTLPFIESTPGYAVSIALVARDGTPYIGVVYDPLEKTLYHAVKGCGAFRNGNPWILGHVLAAHEHFLTFITDRSFAKHSLFLAVLTELKSISTAMGYAGVKTILHGGAAMNACWALENSPACYFKFPKPEEGGGSLWDYAATACLFTEVGAVVSDIEGKSLDLNRSDSTFMNHRGVLYASDQGIAREIISIFQAIKVLK